MSSKFGLRKTYHSSSDTVVMNMESRAAEKVHYEPVSSRLLTRRARLMRRESANLRIDTGVKLPVYRRDVESPESPDSPDSPASPASPGSPDTPSITAPAVAPNPSITQGVALGAVDGISSPVSPASPASPSGVDSPASATASSLPPFSTSTTVSQTTSDISTITQLPPQLLPPSSSSLLASTTEEASTTSTGVLLSTLQTSTLSAASSVVTKTTSKVGVPTTLVPLITATAKKPISSTSSSSPPSSASTIISQTTKTTDGLALDTTIAAPSGSSSTTTTAATLSAIVPTGDAAALAQKGITSESGNLGVHVVFPVVFSIGVIAAFIAILWFRKRRSRSPATEDQASLSITAAPMGQTSIPRQGDSQGLRFRSDGSVMADLMDAAYAAENGVNYRQTQLSAPGDYVSNEKMYGTVDRAPVLELPRRSGNTVFSWLGGLRSGAPTIRGSIAPPQSEATSGNRTTVTGWPQGFEPADPQAVPLPVNTRCLSYWSESSQAVTSSVASPPPVPAIPSAMFEPRVQSPAPDLRPLQLPPSPTQTAITSNTAAVTESSWNTWGVEQHPRGDNVTGKNALWGKWKTAMGGNR